MKFKGVSESSNGERIFEFVVGTDELRNLREILAHARKAVPQTVDAIPYLGRLRNMNKVIEKACKEYGVKKPKRKICSECHKQYED